MNVQWPVPRPEANGCNGLLLGLADLIFSIFPSARTHRFWTHGQALSAALAAGGACPAALGLGHCIGQTWKETLLYTESDTPIRTGREYGRVDRGLLRQELLARYSLPSAQPLNSNLGPHNFDCIDFMPRKQQPLEERWIEFHQ